MSILVRDIDHAIDDNGTFPMNSANVSGIMPQLITAFWIECMDVVRSGIIHHAVHHNRRGSAIWLVPACRQARHIAARVGYLQARNAIAVRNERPRTLVNRIDPYGDSRQYFTSLR